MASSSRPPYELEDLLKRHNQPHVLRHWSDLSLDHRRLLHDDVRTLDLPRIVRTSLRNHRGVDGTGDDLRPVPASVVSTVGGRTAEEREAWWRDGLKAVSHGELAVLLLSGGQGTRLGCSKPKGCLDIGLPSGKSLFQLQAERILRIQTLASQSNNGINSNLLVPIHWYIMTSPSTDDAIRSFFKDNKYFGLQSDQISFFKQGTLPCISEDGRFIMETPYKIAKAPDGNGGVYSALKSSGMLEDMITRGVKYINCYGVDNALVRVADPTFLGYLIDKNVSVAAKVVKKANEQEKVGIFVKKGSDGPISVIEYSEMDTLACNHNGSNEDSPFCWSNVCLHLFTLDFLKQVVDHLEKENIYHLAKKKIPSIDGYTTGFKLEQFIFDAFEYASSIALFEVRRDEEFAPVKNFDGSSDDTPSQARQSLLKLHAGWVTKAGGIINQVSVPIGVEVSPLWSYAGENLELLCHGRTFDAHSHIC